MARNPMVPVSVAVVSIPRAAMILQSNVNEGCMWRRRRDVLGMPGFFCDVTGSVEASHRSSGIQTARNGHRDTWGDPTFGTYKHKIQFHPAGAPVPLSIRFRGVR